MGKLKGFTFVEMLVVIGVISILLPSIFAIFFSILQQQLKILSLTEVKKQGDYALTFMKNNIQNNAISIQDSEGSEICDSQTNDLIDITNAYSFLSKDNSNFSFYTIANNLIYESSSAISDLTNSKVRVTSYTIKCNRSSVYSTPIINVAFTIQYNSSSNNPEDISSMNYQTNIKMKNFK